jgi:hypothetical protein
MELKDIILATLDEINLDEENAILDTQKEKNRISMLEKIESSELHKIRKFPQKEVITKTTEPEIKLPPPIPKINKAKKEISELEKQLIHSQEIEQKECIVNEEFLKNVRERILVLFDGFQAPNNTGIDAKIDLTLNFLEYLLATIDEKLKNKG